MAVDSTGLSGSLANVASAIRRAAQATGANFDYLLSTAKVESNLNPNIKASTSSATGLFQFIEQTWLATLKAASPALGYGEYAKSIVRTPGGGYTVPDPAMRSTVLNLRRDPAANAAMAGVFAQQNSAELRERLGRPPTGGELYIAHFLGAGGAAKLISQAESSPGSSAASSFSSAASANRSIFYDRQGRARTAADVYRVLVGKFESARQKTQALAAVTPAPPGAPASALAYSATNNATSAAHDPAGTISAIAALSAVPVARTSEPGKAFYSLFQTEGGRGPISPVVSALWGGSPAEAEKLEPASLRSVLRTAALRTAEQRAEAGGLRDLYQNGRRNTRGLFDGRS
jgi:Transglycosylase SLT domain